jgi:hypothetical protein
MRKCVNCGGNNSDTEIYCDWCGEKLLPERRITLFSFLKYYLHIFAILGIIGAIIYYIASFLVDPNNDELLNKEFLGILLKNILEFGIFLCFCFFILLLTLLIMEIMKVKKQDLSLKFLQLILLFLLVFVLFLFITIGSNLLDFVVCLITITVIYVIYAHILDILFFWETDNRKKSRNLLIITLISIVIFVMIVVFVHQITDLVNYLSQFSLPSEDKPELLKKISNGFFVGGLIGVMIGSVQCGALMIVKGLIEATVEVKETISDMKNIINIKYFKKRE